MQCPQCAEPLQATVYEGVPIHTCEGCGGEFVDGEAFARIVENRHEKFSDQQRVELAQSKPSFGGVATQPQRMLECPACARNMKITNYAGDSGIFVDLCSVCGGLWLDHAELEKIQVVMERWADEASPQLQSIAEVLEVARFEAATRTSGTFSGSRFGFVNALINRILDAA
jgi:Zn-finger nucleic acid-binding protein